MVKGKNNLKMKCFCGKQSDSFKFKLQNDSQIIDHTYIYMLRVKIELYN
jgi:hypothetical protein